MTVIRWACFFVLCWGLAVILAQTHGCAGANSYWSRVTQSHNGPTVTEKAGATLPKNMDTLEGFEVGPEGVKIGSLANYKIVSGGWLWMVAGLGLLIGGALLFTGSIPYVGALTGPLPVPGGIVAGVGALALLWPTISGPVGVIAVAAIAMAALAGILYAVGRFTQAHATAKRGKAAAVKLSAKGKPREATAARRAADLSLDKAMAAASAARNPE